jgi:hypothetical protein
MKKGIAVHWLSRAEPCPRLEASTGVEFQGQFDGEDCYIARDARRPLTFEEGELLRPDSLMTRMFVC